MRKGTVIDRPIRGWYIEATCPECGHTLGHVADGRPSGLVSRAIAACTHCGRKWAVQVTISTVTGVLGHARVPRYMKQAS